MLSEQKRRDELGIADSICIRHKRIFHFLNPSFSLLAAVGVLRVPINIEISRRYGAYRQYREAIDRAFRYTALERALVYEAVGLKRMNRAEIRSQMGAEVVVLALVSMISKGFQYAIDCASAFWQAR